MAVRSLNLANSGIQAAFANNGVWDGGVLDGQQVVAAIIGDSITNSNTSATSASTQDSWGYGLARKWEMPLAGWFTPTNDNPFFQWGGPNVDITNNTDDDRGYNDAVGGPPPRVPNDSDPLGTHSQSNYGVKSTREYEFTGNAADDEQVNQARFNVGEGDWFDLDWMRGEGDTVHGGMVTLGFAGALDSVNILTQGTSFANQDVSGIASAGGYTLVDGPTTLVASNEFYRVNCRTVTSADETGDFIVHVGFYVRVPDKSGWQMLPCGVGGAKYTDWNINTGLMSDANWVGMFGTAGNVAPVNLFIIALGSNDGTDLTRTHIEDMVQRCHDANSNSRVLLVAQYGTPASISQETALAQADLMLAVAKNGITHVSSDRIAVLNTPAILGAAAEAGDLTDTIHPKRSWVDEVSTAWWTEIQNARDFSPYDRKSRVFGGRYMVRPK